MTEIGTSLQRHGYALLQQLAPASSTLEVAGSLGVPLTPRDGPLVQQLMPRATATPNTYSGNFGLGMFPFHTDLAHWRSPPRYLVLRCLHGYEDVPTMLIDGESLVETIGANLLSRAVVKARRPQNGAIPLLRLVEKVGDRSRIRWDSLFIQSASRVGEEGCRLMQAAIADAPQIAVALSRPGDTLILDNWRMLHARASVPEGRADRILERVYLEEVI